MFLFSRAIFIINARIKNKISWFHLFKLKVNRQGVILISLVPSIQLKPEFLPEIIDNLSNKCTAIQIKGGTIMLLSWIPIPCSIRHPEIFLSSLYKFISESLFKIRIPLAIFQSLIADIVSIFYCLLLCFTKLFKISLEGGLGGGELV